MSYKIEFSSKKDVQQLQDYLQNGYHLTFDNIKLLKRLNKKIDKILNKKPMNTSSRKAKGRNLQQWVCKRIALLFNIEYNQSDDQCLVHSREMGQSGTDIVLRGEVYKQFKYDIECKNTENLSLYKTIEQASNNTEIGRSWLIVHKKNNNKPVAIMSFESFEKIIKNNLFKK